MSNLKYFFQQAEPGVLQLETMLIIGLLLITAIALVVNRLRFPYTVALVFAGLLLASSANAATHQPGQRSGIDQQ